MSTEKIDVMLGLDIAGMFNFPAALYSAQRFLTWASESKRFNVILGVSHSAKRKELLRGSLKSIVEEALWFMSDCCHKAVFWDNIVANQAQIILKVSSFTNCQPYYDAFSYGSAVNRLLLLATISNCKYVVRFDPGTLPPENATFDQVIGQHVDLIGNSNIVVSRRYETRTSLRDTYVYSGDDQAMLLKEYTGFDPKNQTTSGALLTSRTPGIPAICFDKFNDSRDGSTLVWGTDDAIYQILPETKGSIQLQDFPVVRFDPVGKPKLPIEYYRGVAGMVFLSNYRENQRKNEAIQKMHDFLNKLQQLHLDPAKYLPALGPGELIEHVFSFEEIAPDDYLKAIMNGCDNHEKLMVNNNWQKMAETLTSYASAINIYL